MKDLNLSNCTICPHSCGINRSSGEFGICKLDAGLHIANICLHKGEEPIYGSENGICNVFFSHCNLHCIYCQNYQISQTTSAIPNEITDYNIAVEAIANILRKDVFFLGFVSPSSHIPQMLTIIDLLHKQGLYPKIIYNTNAYDSVETLRQLENIVDIYLPDFKYASNKTGEKYSGIKNYFDVALKAIGEMYKQKKKKISEENPALIIRHLVLPNEIANSLQVLETIAKNYSNNVFLSLMSQYFPIYKALNSTAINRILTKEEYNLVLEKLDELEFSNGWTQLLESNDYYQPDFDKKNPFDN